MGGVVGIYVFLGLGSDGDLTETTSAGVIIQLASATINANTWFFLTTLALIFSLTAFLAALYRVYRGFQD
jgi:hypothetical protein